MSDTDDRKWLFYLKDMMDFATNVLTFTKAMNQTQFVSDRLVYDATLRNLELIGEAATHIPDTVRSTYPEIPWRRVIATRNKLIHGYLGIDEDILWSIIRDDVPELLSMLKTLTNQSDT